MNNNKTTEQEVKNICPICKSENVIKWTKAKDSKTEDLFRDIKCKRLRKNIFTKR